METIEVVYDGKVFKPLKKIRLKRGSKLKLVLKRISTKKFVKANMPEEKISKLEKEIENEGIY